VFKTDKPKHNPLFLRQEMPSEQPPTAFAQLAKPVQKALTQAGFTEPTLPQTMAFPLSSQAKTSLDCATALGKPSGSASRLSACFKRNPRNKGIQVIYITPLRAPTRYAQSLTFGLSNSLLHLRCRHGDPEIKTRRATSPTAASSAGDHA
jgi:Lhr-like helicase